jgi:chromosome segregation ATPase
MTLEEALQEIEDLKEQVKDLEEDVKQLQDEYNDKDDEIRRSDDNYNDCKSEIRELEEKLSNVPEFHLLVDQEKLLTFLQVMKQDKEARMEIFKHMKRVWKLT